MRAIAQAAHAGKVVALAPQLSVVRSGCAAHVAVTGGTGGLGLLVAVWMVSTGRARRVALLSSTGRASQGAADDGRTHPRHLAALTCSGAEVVFSSSDGSFAEDSRSGLDHSPPFDIVLHASGVLTDALVARQTLPHLRRWVDNLVVWPHARQERGFSSSSSDLLLSWTQGVCSKALLTGGHAERAWSARSLRPPHCCCALFQVEGVTCASNSSKSEPLSTALPQRRCAGRGCGPGELRHS